MRISDWSSDVCSSDFPGARRGCDRLYRGRRCRSAVRPKKLRDRQVAFSDRCHTALQAHGNTPGVAPTGAGKTVMGRSEEHTSELQSLMRSSYAVFCLKKKNSTHLNAAHKLARLMTS